VPAPRVLFLGANTAQLPYLRAARAQGWTVVATDRNPEAPGARLADRFHAVGYDDVGALLEVARAEGLGPDDRVFTAAAHFAWEGACRVAAALGIPFVSPQAVDTCLDKTKLYGLLAEQGVAVPPWSLVEPGKDPELDPEKSYYLKSDYGKSPRYCWRVAGGELPERPAAFDAFYRRAFVLQEEVRGTHLRLNLYGAECAVFLRAGETNLWLPVPVLGHGHDAVLGRLRALVRALGLERRLVKLDLVVGPSHGWVLDLGLDPPLRLRLLCEHLGLDFAAAYLRAALEDDPAALPAWEALCRPLLVSAATRTVHALEALERAA
jgi:hypothetical protein